MSYPNLYASLRAQTVEKIDRERFRQNKTFGDGQFRSMAPEHVLAVLVGEVGELAKAVLEGTNIEEEIIHVAAVAARWLDECYPQ